MATRRDFLHLSLGGLLGAAMSARLPAHARAWPLPGQPTGGPGPTGPAAKACILLWMNGGPSHVDTWDPKPGTVEGGPFKAIPTRIPKVSICEHLPRLAEAADKLCIVRSLGTREGNHDRARHLVHTGYAPSPTVAHPSLGAWVSEELGRPDADLPAYVAINGAGAPAGFLGVQHGPFRVQDPAKPPQNVAPAAGVDPERFRLRQEALAHLEADFAARTADGLVKGRMQVYDKARRLMASSRLDAFDLGQESEATRDRYGRTTFGEGCLLARRLVEAGVPFVEVGLDGWDTHKDGFTREAALMASLDAGFGALLLDLAERGRLQDTLVLCLGEFGRTPAINADEGRDHHPQAWSAVLAGAGIRVGQAWGATDRTGEAVVDRPVRIEDFFATLATVLGLDATRQFATPLGRPLTIVNKGVPVAGLLRT